MACGRRTIQRSRVCPACHEAAETGLWAALIALADVESERRGAAQVAALMQTPTMH
jgi:RNA polymerase subunit RPABC4/transcription elongation factor Spt4